MTGGVAVGHVKIAYSYADTFGGLPDDNYSGSSDAFELGWTIGGGAEFRLDERWSLRAEYLYVDLASSVLSVDNSLGLGTNTITYDNTLQVSRIGLTFQF